MPASPWLRRPPGSSSSSRWSGRSSTTCYRRFEQRQSIRGWCGLMRILDMTGRLLSYGHRNIRRWARQRDLHRFSHDGSHRSDTGNPVLVFLSIVWSIVDLSASVKRTRCRADCGRTGLRCGIETAGPGRRRLPHASQCPGADRLSVVPHSYGLHVGHLSRSCPSAGRSRPCPV